MATFHCMCMEYIKPVCIDTECSENLEIKLRDANKLFYSQKSLFHYMLSRM